MTKGSIIPLVTPSLADDGELVRRAVEGSTWAEEMLYRRHAGTTLAVLRRLLGRADEAEDALQDAFVTVLERLPQLRDPSSFRSWLMSAALRNAHRRWRRRRLLRRLGFGSHEESLQLVPEPGLSPELCAQVTELSAVLAGTPWDRRIAWMLRHVDGYTLPEVAELCGCSLATAKRRIAAADEIVRARVGLEAAP